MSGPGMRRTTWGDLAVPFIVMGITVFVLLRFSYDSIPPLHYVTAVPLAALAVAEFVAARRVRAAVRHDPNARPMAALVIARCVALGKASSLVGAGVVGAVVGLLAFLVPDVAALKAATNDAAVGGAVLAAAVGLVTAGLLLERAGIDPNNGRDPRDRPA
jgi:hypothetical protein